MLKKYSVNDISKYFSIPKQTIRFFEDKGLIHSHRNPDNGYRYYTYEDINQIFDLIVFHPLNFKIQELNTLLNEADSNDYMNMLEQKKTELQAQIDHLKALTKQVNSTIQDSQQVQNKIDKPFEIVTCPQLVIDDLTNYSPNGVLFTTPYQKENKRIKNVCFRCQLSPAHKVTDYQWGFILKKHNRGTFTLMPQPAIHEIINLGSEGEMVIKLNQKLAEYHENTNYRLGNQIVGKLLLRCHSNGIRQRYAEIWVPIAGKGK